MEGHTDQPMERPTDFSTLISLTLMLKLLPGLRGKDSAALLSMREMTRKKEASRKGS